ncbi:MAG TPA: hypothetical protein ENI07_23560 [Desulfobacterales bacterium]|nr:hypothetical protein [Desulfobacterales bacterium]
MGFLAPSSSVRPAERTGKNTRLGFGMKAIGPVKQSRSSIIATATAIIPKIRSLIDPLLFCSMIHLHKLQVYCYRKARIVPKVKNLYFFAIERVMIEGW